MTDKPGGIDPEIIENFGRSLSAIVRRTNWTELRQVKLGAEVGGAQRVKVPEAQRKAPYEVYYRELDNAGYGTAINADAGVPERYDLLVWIGHPPTDKDRWHVFARVTAPELDAATNEPGTQSHASQHSLRNVGFDGGSSVGVVGADPVFVDDRQLSAVAIIPDNGLTVRVTPGWIVFDGARTWFSGSIQDLTTHMPSGTGKALYVLIEIASDLTVYLSDGSEFSFTLPAADLSTYVPASTAGRYQVGAVCLRKTTTQINWTNIWAGLGLRAANTGTLATVEDITISGVADNEVLAYDSGSGDWINQTAAEAGLAAAAHAHDAADVTYTPTVATDWDSDADPGDVDEALDQLAERVDDLEGATVDAGDVTYTPTTATDWDSDADPGDVDAALDQLAERVDDLENAGGGSLTVKEADGTPTVAGVTTIVVTNGTLTDDTGGQVTLDFGSAATDGAAIHDNVSGEISAITEKETPVNADLLLIEDSDASYAKKYIEIGNLPASGGGYTEGARAYNNANISINNDSSTTLTFNSERWDTDTIHDTGSNTSRLTCKTTGVYLISATIDFASNANGRRQIWFVVDGTTTIAMTNVPAINGANVRLSLTTIYSLTADQYVEAVVYQSSGGALNVTVQANWSPEFMMQRIG